MEEKLKKSAKGLVAKGKYADMSLLAQNSSNFSPMRSDVSDEPIYSILEFWNTEY